jgi:hypothetical protein
VATIIELMRQAEIIGGFGVGLHSILANVAFSIGDNAVGEFNQHHKMHSKIRLMANPVTIATSAVG